MSAAFVIPESPQVESLQPVTESADFLPLTRERKLLAVEVLVRTGGNQSKAAKSLGCTRQNINYWIRTDPAFAEAVQDALEAGTENLEEKYYDRALTISDRAAEFLLKARRPEKYRDTYKVELDGEQNPVQLANAVLAVFGVLREAIEAHRSAQQLAGESGDGVSGPSSSSSSQPAIDTTAMVHDGPAE